MEEVIFRGAGHHSKLLKLRWANPEYREHSLRVLRKAWARKPTRPELIFKQMCEMFDIPLKYVGDGTLSIQGFNPDFVDNTGRRIAVEIFGDYWHSPLRRNIPSYMIEDNRKAIFKKYGWDLTVIWEHELKSPNNVLKKLRCIYGETTLHPSPN